MAGYLYFGDGLSATDGNWNTAGNWYTTPMVTTVPCCGCPTYSAGTKLGGGSPRVPTATDWLTYTNGVIFLDKCTTQSSGATAPVYQIGQITSGGATTKGALGGSSTWTVPLTTVAAFSVGRTQVGPAIGFADTMTFTGSINISAPNTVNYSSGTPIITPSSFTSSAAYSVTNSGGTWNTGFDANIASLTAISGSFNNAISGTSCPTTVTGSTFAAALNTGTGNLTVTGGSFAGAVTTSGANTSISGAIAFNASITVNMPSGAVTATFGSGPTYNAGLTINRPQSGSSNQTVNFNGGTLSSTCTLTFQGPGSNTGKMTVNCAGTTFNCHIPTGGSPDNIARLGFNVTAGSYSPPAVSTPRINNGNGTMTFSNSATTADPGFQAAGLTFNEVINLTGYDILLSGLP